MALSLIDAAIVAGYLLLVFVIGAYMERRAKTDMESYFLGGRTISWWMLGLSGSSTYFDIAGTMWMVSVFYDLGMRGMWQHAFWCFPFAGFVLAYKAKWAYRSGVLTGMEWLVFRYGTGRAGQAARFVSVVTQLIMLVLMLGYAGTGVSKFVAEFLPFDRSVVVPILFGFTGLYVLLGGFFSVVYSDFIQTILLSFAALYIAVVAFIGIDPEAFRQTVGEDWFSLRPVMRLPAPVDGYPDVFGLLIVLWVSRGLISLLAAAGGGADFQRFRAARNEAEASKIGLAWGLAISVRWGMVMGFTAFGLSILASQGEAVDSESVLPMMINRVLPVGIKGIVIAGLLAAFMSTFDSTLNVAASFVVNDLVKPVWKTATPRALVRTGYVATAVVVLLGILISMYTDSIAKIWNPINFALGAALIAPGLLAAYWWRIGGWAVVLSGACTLPAALYVKVFTDWRELQYFPVLAGVSLVTTVLGAYLFGPPPDETLKDFYRKVRPFGVWGPVRAMLRKSGEDSSRPASDRYDIPVAIVATVFFVAVYVLIMDIVLHNWGRAGALAAVVLATGAFLYYAWWRRLPESSTDTN
ncbi:MAG: sodium:solute symporter [Candidatus Hydrogenedentota bacterium]